MEDLFLCASEFLNFRYRHPEYNFYEEVKDESGEVIGYNAKIVNEN